MNSNKKSTVKTKTGDLLDLQFLEVKVYNGDFDNAVRKFKTLVQKERVAGELKQRSSYEKPSEKKRRKKREAVQRVSIAAQKEKLIASGEWDQHQKKKQKKKNNKQKDRNKTELDNESE